MWIAPEERVVGGQRHLVERLPHAGLPLVLRGTGRVNVEHLRELKSDAQGGVERGARILRDVGHRAAAQAPQLAGRHGGEQLPVDQDLAPGHPATRARVTHQRHPNRRLSRPRLSDEPEDLARVNLEHDLIDDVGARQDQVDLEIANRNSTGLLRNRHRHSPRSRPMTARAKPSVSRLVPIVSSAMAMTGSTTPHGWKATAKRFSLIISPQSEAGGWMPSPMKFRAAIRPIEYVRRRPNSTISGLITLGSSSLKMIRLRGSPTASAALTKSRSTTCWAAPRITRATRGACEIPTIRMIRPTLGPNAVTNSSASTICGKAMNTSEIRIRTSSTQPLR